MKSQTYLNKIKSFFKKNAGKRSNSVSDDSVCIRTRKVGKGS